MKTQAFLVGVVLLLVGCRAEAPETEATPVRPAVLQTDISAPDSTTEQLFKDVMAFARADGLHERPFGEIMQTVGMRFLQTPYVAGTLDEPEKETLIVDLTGFDCVLYVEAVLALARGIAVEDYAYETFVVHIQDQRYRDGALNG